MIESDDAPDSPRNLSAEYRRLWELADEPPDVFQFLDSHADAAADDQFDVLRVDQQQRWRRRDPLPLQVYLQRLPELAVRADLVRLLVEGDRVGRREAMAASHYTLEENTPDELTISVTPWIPSRDDPLETLSRNRKAAGGKASDTRPGRELLAGSPYETVIPESSRESLDFDLDTSVGEPISAERLRPMLDSKRFTLLRRLGAGGMGVVFEAHDEQRGEFVALKTMRQVDPGGLARFKQEFRSLSDITHQNLVQLYQLFSMDDCWFFTMELVDGDDILTHVRGVRLDPEDAATRCTEGAYDASTARTAPGKEPAAAARSLDQSRLREALTQLAEGVHALHTAGKLHRDIKPTNVMVSRAGRVVLLDFGLTADIEPKQAEAAPDRQIVGTLAHMSPEQALGLKVSAASDWYSVGVILYQALTGELPFTGEFEEVVLRKQKCQPTAPDELVAGLPADLVKLCVELLDRDPARRPSGEQVLYRLRGRVGSAPAGEPGRRRLVPLIGRDRHRQVLESAHAGLLDRKTTSVFLFGRSGTGMTALVRAFLDEIRHRDDTLILAGRCYEQEWVPFKAVDSLIDSLATHLKRLSRSELEGLLPADAYLLARVFPVLRGVEGVLRAHRQISEMPDHQELRLRVFAALRELLFRLSERANLVLMIDDLQWGDADSAMLLTELFDGDHAPIMLFVGCFRLEEVEQSRLFQILGQARKERKTGSHHRELAVEVLTLAESRELALALIGRDDPISRAQAHLIARESGGNPLFIEELAKHLQAGDLSTHGNATSRIDLETVLWARIQAQPVDAQRLLESIAVSGRPIPESLAFRAAGLEVGGRASVGVLRAARLIRGTSPSSLDQVEIYHDRVRQTILRHLPPEALRGHHERLASVLEGASSADPEVLAEHYRGAGDDLRASTLYIQAAENASAALAFDHAARLYHRAIELGCGTLSDHRRALRRLGDALASNGKGGEAADAYLRAASGATAAENLELTRLASTELLISGHVDEGLRLLQRILRPLGLRMPATPQGALLSLVRHRVMLRLRGLKFRPRDETQVSAEDLTRIDLCWSAVAGLSVIDPIRGADFQTRGLLLALRAGEPFRIARAMAMEAAHQSTAGVRSTRYVSELIGTAETLAVRLDSHQVRAIILMVRGISGLMLGEWTTSKASFEQAEILFRNHCTGVTWERDTVQSLSLWATMNLGQIAELKRRWAQLIKEAQECGDLYAATTLSTFYMATIRLAEDNPSGVEQALQHAMNQWPRQGFFIQHSAAFRSLVHLDLYRGRVQEAWERTKAVWPEYSRSMLLRIQMIRIQMLELHARTALAQAEIGTQPGPEIQQAEQDARKLANETQRWAIAHSHFVRAGIAALREDARTALNLLSCAAELYDSADMHLSGWVMRYKMGEIMGDAHGRDLIGRAEEAMRAQSIASPARWSRMVAPGFSRIITGQVDTKY